MSSLETITVSAPGKIHLLGEHAVVYGKPAILASVDLRVRVTIEPGIDKRGSSSKLRKVIEPIVKNKLELEKFPQYKLEIESDLPVGCGLGSSAAVSSAYIAALLSFLKIKWDKSLVNELAYEAEKVFNGNPSGGDNSTVVYGGRIWFRKEDSSLKLIQPLSFTIPQKLAKNFVIINTGTPKESTKEMVTLVQDLYEKEPKIVNKFLENQEKLVRKLLAVIKEANEKELLRIIREGERNLESIGVASKSSQEIIRKIEKAGGGAKICGGGGKTGPTGALLCYHKNKKVVERVAKSYNLPYFSTALGVEGVRKEL
ncbi:MAG: mevalonate kinase [bacterium]|nr:mevalonate kinase [bacterium]